MELAKYLDVLKRKWFFMAVLLTGAVTVSLLGSVLMAPLYESYAKIVIKNDGRVPAYGLRDQARGVSEFQNPQNIAAVARRAGLTNFAGKVKVQIEPQPDNSSLVRIAVTSRNAKETSTLANALAGEAETFFSVENDPIYLRLLKETSDAFPQTTAYLKQIAEKARKALGKTPGFIIPGDALVLSQDGWQELLELRIVQEQYFWLGRRLNELKEMKRVPPYQVKIIQFASVPAAPVSPKILQNVLMAVVVGFFTGIGVIFIVEYWEQMHTTSKNQERISSLTL